MRILLTTDGSTYSRSAAEALAAMFRPENAEVLVLEVVEPLIFTAPPQMAPGYAPEQTERLKEQFKEAEATTAETAATLRNSGFKVNSRVVESDIRSGILNMAAEWKPDLIVMGSHGRRGVEKFLLGSVAESVARHAKCSVLIVRGQAHPAVAHAA